ncbi:MAG: DUF2889 domain-containing protein [Acidobacteriota bacterium]
MSTFTRDIKVEMEWVDDSNFEIIGSLNDTVHSVHARLLVSYPGYVIQQAEGGIERMPYPGFCQGAYAVLPRLVGAKIGRGFRKFLSDVLGSSDSCNHLHTLVNDMATCAFQMNYYANRRKAENENIDWEELMKSDAKRRMVVLNWMPQLRNTCYIFSDAADKVFEEAMEKEECANS